jgi:hypothetical protein
MAHESQGVITKIMPGYGRSAAWLTIKFTDEQGRGREEDFPCNASGADRLNVGDTLLLARMPLVGTWIIHPSEGLGHSS